MQTLRSKLTMHMRCFTMLGFLFSMLFCTNAHAQDVGITAITAPISSCNSLSSSEKISVTIMNFNSTLVDSIPVVYQLDSDSAVYDTVAGPIQAGDTINFTFKMKLNLSAKGIYHIKAYSALPGDTNSANDTVSITIVGKGAPSAAFDVSHTCFMDSTKFVNNSVKNGAAIKYYAWFFGDSSQVDSAMNPSHLYTHKGSYSVSLVATSASGCTDTVTHSVYIVAPPVVNFSAMPACLGSPTTFVNNSYTTSGIILSNRWKFGDGDTTTVENPVHIYAAAGSYYPELVVTRDSGCTDSTMDTVKVVAIPKASFTITDTCQGGLDSFKSTTADTGISYMWNFGDSSISALKNPVHKYAASGKYGVTLMVGTPEGCADTATDSVIVFPLPVVSFGAGNACLGQSIHFMDSSSIQDSSVLNYNWNFGDSSMASIQNPDHLFAGAGSYTVVETVTSVHGCNAIAQKPVSIFALPATGFVAKTNNSLTVNFIAMDTATGNMYHWDFGDTATATGSTAIHTYAHDGRYLVRLVISNANGCTDTTRDSVTVSTTGTREMRYMENALEVFPNPVTGIGHITCSLAKRSDVQLTVFDNFGRILLQLADGSLPAGQYQFEVNKNNLLSKSQIYFVKLTVDGNITVKKMVVLR